MTEKRTHPTKHQQGFKRVCASLPVELVPAFKELGGSAWLQEQIRSRPTKHRKGFKRVCLSLPAEQTTEFKELGGSAWLQEQIKKALRKK